MQITYVLELLKSTKIKSNIIEKNILEVQKNRTSVACELKTDNTKLSTKDFNEILPSAKGVKILVYDSILIKDNIYLDKKIPIDLSLKN